MAAASRTSRPAAAAAAAAEDHMSSAAAMVVVPTCYDEEEEEEEPRPPAILEAPAMFDPYLTRTAPRGGYWLPPPHHQLSAVQISQHASCYVPMATDADEAVRISPAAHQFIKRKNEVKKVVCIPALPPTSSRPGGGEVIPSDLWAWRKYGQKPIKGSPYPSFVLFCRGYYRCSSSKGCMARKQVERSRSDPNMLVITYTAEHNHPWPMQRNVLAGYSRPHTTANCKKKNSSRVGGLITSSSSPSGNNNVVNLECQQQMTDDMMTIGALDEEAGVAMHQPAAMGCNSIQTADEVFAELEELEPSINAVSANIYSRGGVSYEWHKF
ncbi:hypothetical protein HU200_030217 [Digitaria exilis]|uniref:WRKY domain-containing protein n=1 Tax=Digitaria exilis TaxID=1010633 RepID=A0A835EUH3_9POAL|nr:hypothetical protein HU200_030217 [Digitaria exilis]